MCWFVGLLPVRLSIIFRSTNSYHFNFKKKLEIKNVFCRVKICKKYFKKMTKQEKTSIAEQITKYEQFLEDVLQRELAERQKDRNEAAEKVHIHHKSKDKFVS